jgi:hypothetical protein
MKSPQTPTLPDAAAERMRQRFTECIRELQDAPTSAANYVINVALADGVETTVAHNAGRTPIMVLVSPPRGPLASGRIEEVRPTTVDRTRFVVLKATGYGITVVADVMVL